VGGPVAGSHEQSFTQMRYGERIGRNGTYRVWAKRFDCDGLVDEGIAGTLYTGQNG
jgi:hypothetical protein